MAIKRQRLGREPLSLRERIVADGTDDDRISAGLDEPGYPVRARLPRAGERHDRRQRTVGAGLERASSSNCG